MNNVKWRHPEWRGLSLTKTANDGNGVLWIVLIPIPPEHLQTNDEKEGAVIQVQKLW